MHRPCKQKQGASSFLEFHGVGTEQCSRLCCFRSASQVHSQDLFQSAPTKLPGKNALTWDSCSLPWNANHAENICKPKDLAIKRQRLRASKMVPPGGEEEETVVVTVVFLYSRQHGLKRCHLAFYFGPVDDVSLTEGLAKMLFLMQYIPVCRQLRLGCVTVKWVLLNCVYPGLFLKVILSQVK